MKYKDAIQNEPLVCQVCGKPITDPSYVLVRGDIINTGGAPNIFTCPEQAFNYGQKIIVHSICWIDMLRKYSSPLYDMTEVYKQKNLDKK